MANEQRSPVQFRKFEPRRLLPEGLLGVARSSGEVEREISGVFRRMAGDFGRNADAAAQGEGRRAGLVAGNNPDFRPSRSDTIRGQAYDAAGEKTYMANLEAGLRQDMHQLYEQHRDDPAGFAAASTSLKKRYLNEHVYGEIAGDFSAGFERLADAYRRETSGNAEARARDLALADLTSRLNTLDTTTQQVLAGTDPASESGAALISDASSAAESAIDAAIAAGTLPAAKGEALKIETRRKTAVQFYTAQAAGMGSEQDLAEYRAKLAEDFAAGNLPEVDGDGFAAIERGIAAQARALATENDRLSKDVERRGKSIAERINAGLPPDEAEIRQLIADAGRAPGGEEAASMALDRIAVARHLAQTGLAEGEAFVRGMEAKARDGASPREAAALQAARELAAQKRKAVIDDPVGALSQFGAPLGVRVNGAMLSFEPDKTADDHAAAMGVRIRDAEAAASHWNVPVKLLRPGEARTLGSLIKTSPEQVPAIAEGLVRGAGRQLPALLNELRADAPQIAEIGRIMAVSGNRRAAADALRGRAVDAAGNKRAMPKPEIVNAGIRSMGAAFRLSTGDQELVVGAAQAIAAARMADAGIENAGDAETAMPVFEQALQEAAGRTGGPDGRAYGGLAKLRSGWFDGTEQTVLVPPSMAADRFGDVIGAIGDEDMARLNVHERYSARDIRNAVPVAVAGGYRMAKGDPASDDPQWLEGRDGRPAVIDIEGLRDWLGPRVPGAWR
jgi:hypothetical protein